MIDMVDAIMRNVSSDSDQVMDATVWVTVAYSLTVVEVCCGVHYVGILCHVAYHMCTHSHGGGGIGTLKLVSRLHFHTHGGDCEWCLPFWLSEFSRDIISWFAWKESWWLTAHYISHKFWHKWTCTVQMNSCCITTLTAQDLKSDTS